MAHSRTELGRNIPPTRETFGKNQTVAPVIAEVIDEGQEDLLVNDDGKQEKMLQISHDLKIMKRDQHNLIAKQEKQYGTTIDTINSLQVEIDKAKTQNNSLIEEMKAERDRLGYLESHFLDLQTKFENYQKTLKSLKKQKEHWENSKVLLVETEEKSKRLAKNNRHLRALLMKHHINPNIDAETMGNTIHVRKPQTERKPINAVSPRSRLSVASVRWQ